MKKSILTVLVLAEFAVFSLGLSERPSKAVVTEACFFGSG